MPHMTDAKRTKIQHALTEALRLKLRLWDALTVVEDLIDQDLPPDWLGDLACNFDDAENAEATLEHVNDLLDDLAQKERST